MKFRKIPSLKFLYEINEDGVIRNIKSKHILKPQQDKDGYRVISVYKDNKKMLKKIHRLVAECWCKVPEHLKDYDISELQVNHKDFNKQNNNYRNLEWVTLQENLKYSEANRARRINEYHSKNVYGINSKDPNDIIKFNDSIDAAEFIMSKLNKTNKNTISRCIRDGALQNGKYRYGYYWYYK